MPGRASAPLPRTGDDVADVRDALLSLDRSYVAVQGPPGTGKTHVGAHVIHELVRDPGWRVGVVAQSHAAVEHVLDAVVAAVPETVSSTASESNHCAPMQRL